MTAVIPFNGMGGLALLTLVVLWIGLRKERLHEQRC